jgi:hypothetical protein
VAKRISHDCRILLDRGRVALALLYFLKDKVNDGGVLYGINQSIHHVDMHIVVIPGAFGCLLTGLIYGIFSNWRFVNTTG